MTIQNRQFTGAMKQYVKDNRALLTGDTRFRRGPWDVIKMCIVEQQEQFRNLRVAATDPKLQTYSFDVEKCRVVRNVQPKMHQEMAGLEALLKRTSTARQELERICSRLSEEEVKVALAMLKRRYVEQNTIDLVEPEKAKEKIKEDVMLNTLHPADISESGESSLLGVVQLLREYKKKGDPYNLEKPLLEGDDRSLLNDILYFCHMKDNEDDLRLVREVLNYSTELKQYWDHENKCYHGPISWIEYQDENLALKLLPYFKSRDYRIDMRGILSDKILNEWDKLQASNVEPSKKKLSNAVSAKKKRKLSKVEAESVERM